MSVCSCSVAQVICGLGQPEGHVLCGQETAQLRTEYTAPCSGTRLTPRDQNPHGLPWLSAKCVGLRACRPARKEGNPAGCVSIKHHMTWTSDPEVAPGQPKGAGRVGWALASSPENPLGPEAVRPQELLPAGGVAMCLGCPGSITGLQGHTSPSHASSPIANPFCVWEVRSVVSKWQGWGACWVS